MKNGFIVTIVATAFLSLNFFNIGFTAEDEVFGTSKLMQTVFTKYNKEILPSKPVVVALNLLMLKVKTTVEREGIFESVIALFLEWLDPRVVWDPAMYNNVSELTFDSDKIWLPDIALTNSAEHIYSISKDKQFVIRVTHKGVFNFVPTGTSKTWCELKLLTFPFDIQTCSIEFESWSLNSNSLKFNETSNVIIDPSFSSLQFSLCGYHTHVYEYYYEVTDESFSRLKFDFVVRRKSSFYIINLIFPIATLSLIEPLIFFIPLRDSSSDRVGFGTTNLLTLVVFQTIVTEEMPKTSDAITALSKYIIMLIILSGWAIFESVFVERLSRLSAKPPPCWLSYILERICPIQFEHFIGVHGSGAIDEEQFQDENVVIRPQRRRRRIKCLQRFKFLSKLSCFTVDENDQLFVIENRRVRRSLSTSAIVPFHQRMSVHHNSNQNQRTTCFDNDANTRQHVRFSGQPSSSPTGQNNVEQGAVEQGGQGARTLQRRQSSQLAVKIHRINKERWEDVAARIDFIMFVICTMLAIFLPILLFLPLTLFDATCPTDITGHPDNVD